MNWIKIACITISVLGFVASLIFDPIQRNIVGSIGWIFLIFIFINMKMEK